jgi:hypothetical protein
MQAKRILKRSDLIDKRSWFITRFNESSKTLDKAQASSIKNFDFQSLKNIREKRIDIRKDDSLNN